MSSILFGLQASAPELPRVLLRTPKIPNAPWDRTVCLCNRQWRPAASPRVGHPRRRIALSLVFGYYRHSTFSSLHFAFDKYVTVEENQSQKEIEKEILKEIETPMDMEVEVVEPISTENMMRMEEAANIAATAFGDDHVSVRRMRQEITKKRMEKKVKQTTLFQFVKKPTSASSVTPILSKPTFEGSPSFPCQFSNLSLQK